MDEESIHKLKPRCLIVYSSVTGNTRTVAEALAAVLPAGTGVFPVNAAPSVAGYDFVVLGFWVYRAGPDPRMARYMQTVQGTTVAFFGTLAAYPDSPHGARVAACARELLRGNIVVGSFLCQGRLAPKRLERRLNGSGAGHPMTPERRARLLEGAGHPDAHDLRNAKDWITQIYRGLIAS